MGADSPELSSQLPDLDEPEEYLQVVGTGGNGMGYTCSDELVHTAPIPVDVLERGHAHPSYTPSPTLSPTMLVQLPGVPAAHQQQTRYAPLQHKHPPSLSHIIPQQHHADVASVQDLHQCTAMQYPFQHEDNFHAHAQTTIHPTGNAGYAPVELGTAVDQNSEQQQHAINQWQCTQGGQVAHRFASHSTNYVQTAASTGTAGITSAHVKQECANPSTGKNARTLSAELQGPTKRVKSEAGATGVSGKAKHNAKWHKTPLRCAPINADGDWAEWVLLIGTKERNEAVRNYNLTPEQSASLKKVCPFCFFFGSADISLFSSSFFGCFYFAICIGCLFCAA